MAEARMESTQADHLREVRMTQRLIDHMLLENAGSAAHPIPAKPAFTTSSTAAADDDAAETTQQRRPESVRLQELPLALRILQDKTVKLQETLRREKIQQRSHQDDLNSKFSALHEIQGKLEMAQSNLERERDQIVQLRRQEEEHLRQNLQLKSTIEAQKQALSRCIESVETHIVNVKDLLSLDDFSITSNAITTASEASHHLSSLTTSVRKQFRRDAERMQGVIAQQKSLEVCYEDAKRDAKLAEEQLQDERSRLVDAHRTSLESTKQELESQMQRALSEASQRLREAELFYERSRKQDREELLEACRLLYRAYVPLSRRAHELSFQKQILARRVHTLEKLQVQVTELSNAMTGNLDSKSLPIPQMLHREDVDSNGRRRGHRTVKGIYLFRISAIVVLAMLRIRNMGKRSFFLGVCSRGPLIGDWSNGEAEPAFSGRNARMLPGLYVRNDQTMPELEHGRSSGGSAAQAAFLNLNRVLIHFDRSRDRNFASSRGLAGYNDLLLDLGQGLARRHSYAVASAEHRATAEAEDALVLIRTMALTLARRFKQIKTDLDEVSSAYREAKEVNSSLAAEKHQLERSSKKDAGVLRFLEQRVQELQSEMMQMVPDERFQSTRSELHQLKVSYYELQNQRQRLAADHDVSSHAKQQIEQELENLNKKLRVRSQTIVKLERCVHESFMLNRICRLQATEFGGTF